MTQNEMRALLLKLGYTERVTIIGDGGRRFRLQFARIKGQRAVEFGRSSPARDRALAKLGWRVTRLRF